MTRLVDTHCHLQDPRFDAPGTAAAIDRAREAGIEMILCGYDAPTNEAALAIAETSDAVHPAVGFHPHEASGVSPAMLVELESLAALPQVAAVGEIGLDFYRNLAPHDVQRRVLGEQLAIAVRVGKPVSVHTRGAEEDAFAPLSEYAEARGWQPGQPPIGVMHCFGGTLEQARRYAGAGFAVSIACTITYPRNDELRRVAAGLPLEWLVIETDSPYLPPQFMRGQRNEPLHVSAAAEGIAQARGITFGEVARSTTTTAQTIFQLPVPAVPSW